MTSLGWNAAEVNGIAFASAYRAVARLIPFDHARDSFVAWQIHMNDLTGRDHLGVERPGLKVSEVSISMWAMASGFDALYSTPTPAAPPYFCVFNRSKLQIARRLIHDMYSSW
jgi:hypothetical protein